MVCLLAEAPLGDNYSLWTLAQTSMSQLTVQQSYLLCWELLPDRNCKSMGLWYCGADESPWPRDTPSWYTPVSWMILSKQKNLRLFSSQYNCVFLYDVRSCMVCFVSWGSHGWRLFVLNSRANTQVTIDCSTVLLLVLGVVTRQKPQINGSVVLGADESPWPCGTPSWYTPLSWMILSKQKNIRLFSSQYNCVFLKASVCSSVCPSHLFDYLPLIVSSWNFYMLLPMTKVMAMQKVKVIGQMSRSQRS